MARLNIEDDDDVPVLGGIDFEDEKEKQIIDSIPAAEGTTDAQAQAHGFASGADVPLGYGKYGRPTKPLSEMTLKEAYDFGRQVRSKHGKSSAIGRYQIVGTTMKDVMDEAGLTWNDTFSAENQRKMAAVILRKQGKGAWEGFKRGTTFGLASGKSLFKPTKDAGTPTQVPSLGQAATETEARPLLANVLQSTTPAPQQPKSKSESIMGSIGKGMLAAAANPSGPSFSSTPLVAPPFPGGLTPEQIAQLRMIGRLGQAPDSTSVDLLAMLA